MIPAFEKFWCGVLYALERTPAQGWARASLRRIAESHVSLGDARFAAGRLAGARSHYERALAASPEMPAALLRLAIVATQSGDQVAAEQLLLRVREAAPGDLESLIQLGMLKRDSGQLDEALDCFRRALAIDPIAPAAHLFSGLVHLSRGNFETGWDEHEWRLRLPGYERLAAVNKPVWNGDNPSGKTLLVQNEPTLSDAIHFLRYVPLLAQRGASVIVETLPELAPFVRRMPGVKGVVSTPDELARIAPSVAMRCPLLSLPHRFRTTPQSIPAEPYLLADKAGTSAFRARLESHSRARFVGIAWDDGSAGAFSGGALDELLGALQPASGSTFVALQRPAASRTASPASLIDWTGELRSMADAGDLVDALDLVIGPPTPVTLLAAGIGIPVWFLLPKVADWRWGVDASTTPWYPAARLFRQSATGDWSGVARAVAAMFAA